MKRLSVRLSVIGLLITGGILAMAHAQRGGDEPTAQVEGDKNAPPDPGAPGTSPGPSLVDPLAPAPQQPQPLADLAPLHVTPVQGYGPDPSQVPAPLDPTMAAVPNIEIQQPPEPPYASTAEVDPSAQHLAPAPNAPLAPIGPDPNYPGPNYPDPNAIVGPPGPGALPGDPNAPGFPPDPSAFPPDPQAIPEAAMAGPSAPLDPNSLPLDPNSLPLDPNTMPLDPNALPTDPNALPPIPGPGALAGDPQGLAPDGLPPVSLPAEAGDPPFDPNSLPPMSPGGAVVVGPDSLPPAGLAPDAGGPAVAEIGGPNTPLGGPGSAEIRGPAVAEIGGPPTTPAPIGGPAVAEIGGPTGGLPPAAGIPTGPGPAPLANVHEGPGVPAYEAGSRAPYGQPYAGVAPEASIAAAGNSFAPAGALATAVAPVAGAIETAAVRTAAVPGDRQLEGQQTPFIAIEKRAPREIRVGQAATFEIVIRNAGQVTAPEVIVIDQIPQGTRFLDATPEPRQTADGLAWTFASVEPGQERRVALRLMPEQEGEIGSVARVVCQSHASVRTTCTKPMLAIKQTAPAEVLIGDELQLMIEISNPGTGAAEDVVLEADIPPGLVHRKGREIDYVIGTLQPGESKTVRLQLAADQAGRVTNLIRARGAGSLDKQDTIHIDVVSPDLQMALRGPATRYLRREAAFELELANPGTATARDVQAVVYLPQGLEFKAASHQGRYQQQNHAVYWRLEELPKGQSGKVQLTAVPVASGEQKLRAEGRGSLNTAADTEHMLEVMSVNELVFTIADENNAIEVGSETTYEVRVRNNGSESDSNIEVVAQLPEGLRLVGADGPTKHRADGQVVGFEPLARLAANGEVVFRITAQGSAEGDHRVRVQIRSQLSPTPVTKEEVTRVYRDR